MKKYVFCLILLCAAASLCAAQKIVKVEKPEPPLSLTTDNPAEISDREWQLVNDSLRMEDWKKSADLSSQILRRVKTNNESKKLPQLRYIYLYSLAGEVVTYSMAHNPVNENAARKELTAAADNLIGKEFVMPAREFKANCDKVLNYICTVDKNGNVLRVTATNKGGTAIHSFETVLFDQKIDLKEFIGKEVFLGGTLAKVDFNDPQSNLWIMRLSFVKGFVRVVVDK